MRRRAGRRDGVRDAVGRGRPAGDRPRRRCPSASSSPAISSTMPLPDPAGAADLWHRLLGLGADQPVWIAGSTHRGEDEAVLEAHRQARTTRPDLVLVLAPRHPERVGEVMKLVAARGLAAVRRSELSGVQRPGAPDHRARHRRRAGPALLDRRRRVRGRQPRGLRRPQHAGARPARQAGALRSPHLELPRGGGDAARRRRRRRRARRRRARAPSCSSCSPTPTCASRRGAAAREAAASRHGAARTTLDLVARYPVPGARRRERRGDRLVQGWERGFTAGADGVLAALAGSYRGLLAGREWLYARGVLHSNALDCPVVSIGNLTVGGTGKTPAVELAVRTLADLGYRPAVVSRGYGRRGGGVQIVADAASIRLDAEEAGDEPFLLARRLPGVPVVVGANRYEAGRAARRAVRRDGDRPRRRLPAPHAAQGPRDRHGPRGPAVGQRPAAPGRAAARAAHGRWRARTSSSRPGPAGRPTPPRSARRPRALAPASAGAHRHARPHRVLRVERDEVRRRWRRSAAPGCWPSPASARRPASGARSARPAPTVVEFQEFADHHWYTREDLARARARGRPRSAPTASSRPRRTGCGCAAAAAAASGLRAERARSR